MFTGFTTQAFIFYNTIRGLYEKIFFWFAKYIEALFNIKISKKSLYNTAYKIEKSNQNKWKITINKFYPELHTRFTLAYLLGLYILHKKDINEKRDSKKAIKFALYILMPDKLLIQEYFKTPSIRILAKKFKTTQKIMKIKLKSLKLLNESYSKEKTSLEIKMLKKRDK